MTLTGTRVPAMTAWPCITRGSDEIISGCSAVMPLVCRVPARTRNPNRLRMALGELLAGQAARSQVPGGGRCRPIVRRARRLRDRIKDQGEPVNAAARSVPS